MLPGERKLTCPECGQSLALVRLGIRLNPIKVRIFDALKRAGPDGMDTYALFELIYAGRPAQIGTLKSQIWQMNELLSDTGVQIRGQPGGGSYRMVTSKQGKANG